MNEQITELSLDEMDYVGGGEGFWPSVFQGISSALRSGQEVSQPALNANLGIRG